ncbi:MAG: polysaccharide biosynthesis C-terminal domain-containing protein [Eubacterium sp.]|nr:polysaccharide biosynthesis C-terminal domain-containing protein [Eubacterium sp.]
MDKYKGILKNTFIFGLGIVLSKVIISLMLPLYTRVLSTAEYGNAELLVNISAVAVPICSAAIPSAVFRFGMDKDCSKCDVLKCGVLFMLWPAGLLAVLLAVFGSMPIFGVVGEYSLFFYLITFLTIFRSVFYLYVKAEEKNILFSADVILYNLVLALLNVLFLVGFHMGLTGFFLSIVIANVFSIVLLCICGRILPDLGQGRWNTRLLKTMLGFSIPIIFTDIAWALINATDKVMITNRISEDANGVYSAASKIPAIILMATNAFAEAWVISAIQNYDENQEAHHSEKKDNLFGNVFFIFHLIICFLTLFVYAINNAFVPWFLGEDYKAAAMYTPLLMLSVVFTGYSGYYSSVFSAAKKTVHVMVSVLLGVGANVLLNLWLIPKIGVIGACIATVISSMITCVYRMITGKKYAGMQLGIVKWLISMLVIGVSCAAVSYDRYGTLVSLAGMLIVGAMYAGRIREMIRKVIQYRRQKSEMR